MRDYADLTRRLADLVVGYGANVQPGQIVGVTTYPGKEELTREIARAAYERGARWVDVWVFDTRVKRERLLHADESTLDFVPAVADATGSSGSRTSTRRAITLNGPADPDALDGVDPARPAATCSPTCPTSATSSTARPRTGASPRRRRAAGRRSSTRTSIRTRRTTGCGRRSRTSAGSTSPTRPGPGGSARDRLEASRRPHRAPLRRDPAPRPRHRSHRRPAPLVGVACGGLHDGRRAAALPERPERGDVHDAGPDARATAT